VQALVISHRFYAHFKGSLDVLAWLVVFPPDFLAVATGEVGAITAADY
jgi:hypothetical protein